MEQANRIVDADSARDVVADLFRAQLVKGSVAGAVLVAVFWAHMTACAVDTMPPDTVCRR